MKKPHDLFQSSSLLIVDRNPVRRDRLKRLSIELGFQEAQIFFARSGEEGFTLAIEKDVAFAIVDDSVGFDALTRLHVHFDEREIRDPHTLLFFVSEVASQGIVGRMAEEDVDDFIFRPYSQSEFKKVFTAAIETKMEPTETVMRLREGRASLAAGQIESARKSFEEALPTAGARTASFCYYLGQAAMVEKKFDEAAKHFNAGIDSNPIHFRCLKGMFELRMAQERVEEAYQALKHVSEAYPENPERLMQLIKMAIAGAHYRDLDKMDAIYAPMELKVEGLKKHLAAGHAVLGRSLCVQKNLQAAVKALTRAIELSDQAASFVDYAIESLEKYDFKSDAEMFRQKYVKQAAHQKQAA